MVTWSYGVRHFFANQNFRFSPDFRLPFLVTDRQRSYCLGGSMAFSGITAIVCRNVLSSLLRTQQISNQPVWRSVTSVRLQCTAVSENEIVKDKEVKAEKPKRLIVDPETSIKYMESEAYKETYGDKPVWFHYRRNFKGHLPPKTRKTCIRKGEIATGSPCPVCRDEYLILDYKNVKLLEQFISPFTGDVLDSKKTGICQKQHKTLLIEVLKAQDHGFIEKFVPFREYDYSQYYDKDTKKTL